MSKEETGVKRRGSVRTGLAGRTEGARSATAVRPAGAAAQGPLGPGQRWTAGRKREVVLRLLRGESVQALSRELGVEICRRQQWHEQVR